MFPLLVPANGLLVGGADGIVGIMPGGDGCRGMLLASSTCIPGDDVPASDGALRAGSVLVPNVVKGENDVGGALLRGGGDGDGGEVGGGPDIL